LLLNIWNYLSLMNRISVVTNIHNKDNATENIQIQNFFHIISYIFQLFKMAVMVIRCKMLKNETYTNLA